MCVCEGIGCGCWVTKGQCVHSHYSYSEDGVVKLGSSDVRQMAGYQNAI